MQTESPRFIERDHEDHAWTDMISAIARLHESLSESNQEKIRPKMDEFFKTLHESLLDSKK